MNTRAGHLGTYVHWVARAHGVAAPPSRLGTQTLCCRGGACTPKWLEPGAASSCAPPEPPETGRLFHPQSCPALAGKGSAPRRERGDRTAPAMSGAPRPRPLECLPCSPPL